MNPAPTTPWQPATNAAALERGVPAALPGPRPAPASAEWWTAYQRLLSAAPIDLAAVLSHLGQLFAIAEPWNLVDLAGAAIPVDVLPPQKALIGQLIPEPAQVLAAIDLSLPADQLGDLLLHLCGHLELGHVVPGDERGHWDTLETLHSSAAHRRWDREVQALVAERCPRPAARRVTALQECTATEKAKLGLWRMMGELLGSNRKLHEAAAAYQAAAYQRQAAERLVAMLEAHAGAMLCDGVGLGKTYVATTVIVHYANTWRDQRAALGESAASDPFRVTVLAPHSVVSTWRREAIPALAHVGVPLACIRVLSHTQLSRISASSPLLKSDVGGHCDMEHLLQSDLVIVDEAHNFRSLGAMRTKVLRDILRVQPRREVRRRTLLLTATPINNSLEDLRQELSLLFSQPNWIASAKLSAEYRAEVQSSFRVRCSQARGLKGGADAAPLLIHGRADAKFSDKIEFRTDLNLGATILRLGDYLKHQEKLLLQQQEAVKAAHSGGPALQPPTSGRIAEELLDRVVVQRSRTICKEIERHQNSKVELLFRADAKPPEVLEYADEYDGIDDVLARFLPLFDDPGTGPAAGQHPPLSLGVYMWYDVAQGIKGADEVSPVVGLQRILVLKRLESSPVSFLITLLRLTILHAHRLQALTALAKGVGDEAKLTALNQSLAELLAQHNSKGLAKIQALAGVDAAFEPGLAFVAAVSGAYARDRPAADTDDPPPQLQLFDEAEQLALDNRERLSRLWSLLPALLQDLDTLLAVIPGLADIVFSKFEPGDWPRRLMAGGEQIDWPTTANWGMRIVTDAKIRQLVGRLLLARRSGQKALVFSQFSDTIAYVHSVLRACGSFDRDHWRLVARGGLSIGAIEPAELTALLNATASVTGQTEQRDDVVNSFAPYYRIGPKRPNGEDPELVAAWLASWRTAIANPIDVLLATDVLAEGVNLQDAALLVNYDVHWNPVRMIQRAGRIDRRLNPAIEKAEHFDQVEALAAMQGFEAPRYYWHGRPKTEAPVTISMILPKQLEKALQLRERIAVKTLAIDLTLGLEQGTGAEAEWMEHYKYQGVASLNSLQRDRAIEQLASAQAGLAVQLEALGIQLGWAGGLNGWFREVGADDLAPCVAMVRVRGFSGDLLEHHRFIRPTQVGAATGWLRNGQSGEASAFDSLVVLDGRQWPPQVLPASERGDAESRPVNAEVLLAVAQAVEAAELVELPVAVYGPRIQQGLTSVAASYYSGAQDHKLVKLVGFQVFQVGFSRGLG